MLAMTFTELAIAAVIVLGVLAIVYIAAAAMKVPIPPWVWHIIGVVLVVAAAVIAIRFLASL